MKIDSQEQKVIKAGLVALRENYSRVFAFFNITANEEAIRGISKDLFQVDMLIDRITEEQKKEKQKNGR